MSDYPKRLVHFGATVASPEEEAMLSDGRAMVVYDGDRRVFQVATPKHRDPRGKAQWERYVATCGSMAEAVARAAAAVPVVMVRDAAMVPVATVGKRAPAKARRRK